MAVSEIDIAVVGLAVVSGGGWLSVVVVVVLGPVGETFPLQGSFFALAL